MVPVVAGLLALGSLVTGGMALLLDVSQVWFYLTIAMLVGSALAGLGATMGRRGWSVDFDPDGISSEQVWGPIRLAGRVPWSELVEVGIVTTCSGGANSVFHWVLLGEGGSGCVVPLGLAQEVGLFAALSRLSGFDHDAVALACCSATDAAFRCWRDERTPKAWGRRRMDERKTRTPWGVARPSIWSEAYGTYLRIAPDPVPEVTG